jgi:hypothetical protein
MKYLSHSDLVKIAAHWLSGSMKCGAVLTEIGDTEKPDAIGWKATHSILVECKVTRSDFLIDRKKEFRIHPDKGVGKYRFYLAPKCLLDAKEVQAVGWGLLETVGNRVRIVVPSPLFLKRNWKREARLLYTGLQRVQFHISRPIHEVVAWSNNNVMEPVIHEGEVFDATKEWML